MTEADTATADTPQQADSLEAFKKSWRYKLGLLMIIGGHVIMFASMIMPAVGLLSGGMAAAGVVVGEVISLASIVFLGKQGFLAIKAKVVGAVKAEFARPIGRMRHTIGLILLLLNFGASCTLLVFAWTSYDAAPGSVVWGIPIEEQATFYVTLFFTGEGAFPIAIVVLGADWWERFRDLFVWQPPA